MENSRVYTAEEIAALTAAWNEWKELCAVERCSKEHASLLATKIHNAFKRKIASCASGCKLLIVDGIKPSELLVTEKALCVHEFDYSIWEKAEVVRRDRRNDEELPKKMYKQEIWRRAEVSSDPFLQVVHGELIGPRGIINGIVMDYLRREHSLRFRKGADGKRHLVRDESANETMEGEDGSLLTKIDNWVSMPTSKELHEDDKKALKNAICKRFDCKEMALIYASALNVSLASEELLAFLDMGKSQAYAHFNDTCREMRSILDEYGDKETGKAIAAVILTACREALRSTRRGEALLKFFDEKSESNPEKG